MVKVSEKLMCEHEEIAVACLDCLAAPKKVAPNPIATQRATKSPISKKDKISPLAGEMDISIPVENFEKIVGSSTISVRVFPHYLKRSGWVYLRSNGRLHAKVKAQKIIWQDERIDLTEKQNEIGAGIAIEVAADTWDSDVDIDLGALAKSQVDGFRYLQTHTDGSITHYRGNKAISQEQIEDIDLS